MLYNIIIKSKTSFLDRLFTYEYDEELEIGTRVVVPFGRSNSKNLGIIVSKNEQEVEFESKPIYEVLDSKPIISKELVDLAFFMIKNNISDYSSAINTVLPPGSVDKVKEFYKAKESLLSIDKNLFEFLDDYKSFDEIDKKFPNKFTKLNINDWVKKDHIDSHISLEARSSIKYKETVHILDENFHDKIRKNAIKQIKVLEYLRENGPTEKSRLLAHNQASTSVLNSLIDKGLISIEKEKIYRKVLDKVEEFKKIKLNKDQEKVYQEIIGGAEKSFLLHGVTGSGKTEIYLQLVEYYLKKCKEAIILVPEISLTPQTIDRFQGRFGNNIAVLHSKLSISERADQWRMIKNKDVKIVVGARSAIFAPFDNIGIIIIDEEHEDSYKSENNPKYSAIEIAKKRAEYHGAKLVLGTATPSVKTFFDSQNGEINLLQLKNRVNQKELPNIEVVDMRQELKKNNFTMFSESLQEKINQALEKKEQVILFLNKRGHSSFVFCRRCGYVHRCDACDISMTYHKSKDRLICHYCGRTAKKPSKCVNCGSTWIKEYGAGTEMLEEETKNLFPQARIFRMDADTVNKKEDYSKVYKKMNNKEIDILIGTQMLAKGLDFSGVSVVGVVSADISLNIPDFRAGEKTYNLLTQVSGRAGRKDTLGDVVIQTYSPDNYAIDAAAKNDYESFFQREMESRRLFNYPPYINILNINLSSKDRYYAIKIGRKLTQMANEFLRKTDIDLLEITGPTPSVIEKINNRYRFDIIIKSHNKKDLIDLSTYLRQLKDNNVYVNYRLEVE